MSNEEQVMRRAWAVRISAFDRAMCIRCGTAEYWKALKVYTRACRVCDWANNRFFGDR